MPVTMLHRRPGSSEPTQAQPTILHEELCGSEQPRASPLVVESQSLVQNRGAASRQPARLRWSAASENERRDVLCLRRGEQAARKERFAKSARHKFPWLQIVLCLLNNFFLVKRALQILSMLCEGNAKDHWRPRRSSGVKRSSDAAACQQRARASARQRRCDSLRRYEG